MNTWFDVIRDRGYMIIIMPTLTSEERFTVAATKGDGEVIFLRKTNLVMTTIIEFAKSLVPQGTIL